MNDEQIELHVRHLEANVQAVRSSLETKIPLNSADLRQIVADAEALLYK